MVVIKQLAANRKDGYTHDVHVFGRSAKERRGIQLKEDDHVLSQSNQTWFGIRPIGSSSAAAIPTRVHKTPSTPSKRRAPDRPAEPESLQAGLHECELKSPPSNPIKTFNNLLICTLPLIL